MQKPVSNQLPFNLLWRMIEAEILPQCVQEEIAVLVYSPLMHGMLADRYQTAADVPDGRARSRHFSGDRDLARHGEPGCEAETFAAIDGIRAICRDAGRAMADVSLAWIMQQPGIVSVIAGAASPKQLQQNLNSVDSSLTQETVDRLNEATSGLKQVLGSNPDMWDGGENSRYR